MNTFRTLAAGLVVATMVSGCAANQAFFSVVADQPDATIAVDGAETTSGKAIVETWPEYGFPQSHKVTVRRPGFRTQETEIHNAIDWARAGLLFSAVAGGSLAAMYMSSGGALVPTAYWVGVGGLAVSPVFFFTSNRFQPTYRLAPMERGERQP